MPNAFRPLAALVVATTIAPWLGAQSAMEAPASALAPAPAGLVASPRAELALRREVPEALTRSLAKADSLAPRKRAFHIGAVGGGLLAGGFMLALAQSSRNDGGDTDDGGPGYGFVLASAGVGALLGGVAGVIVHDIAGAAGRR